MANEDRLYPLQPSDDVQQQIEPLSSPWTKDTEAKVSATNTDDYTFTEDGLKDGISVGEAERFSPIDPKYRGEQSDDEQSDFGSPWAKYAKQTPPTPSSLKSKP